MRFFIPMLALLLAACGRPQAEGSRLHVTVIGDAERPGSLAPYLVAQATQPTLIGRDGAGQLVAGLASSWRFVDDGRGLILRLRPRQWSDGKPLVAGDIVAAFRRAGERREPVLADAGIAESQAVLAGKLPPARLGVLAPISRVVELRLEAASPLLLGWLAEPQLGIVATKRPATLADYSVTGPTARRVLKRRSLDASPESRPAEIIVESDEDVKAAVARFAAGKTDIVMGDGLTGLGDARSASRSDALRIDPLWGVYGYAVNGVRGATADAGVRRALAMAVDRNALASGFGLAAIAPAQGLLPPSLGGVQPDWAGLGGEARLAEARRLLAAAGWTAANPLRLVLLLPPGRDHRNVAEKVAADWARIGVVLAVTEVAADTHDRLVARGDFDLAISEASVPVPDAAALLARWRCGKGAAYCNPAADAALAAARAAPGARRPALLNEAEAQLLASPPLIPLFTPVRWALVGRDVDGWVPNRGASHPLARLAVTGRRR